MEIIKIDDFYKLHEVTFDFKGMFDTSRSWSGSLERVAGAFFYMLFQLAFHLVAYFFYMLLQAMSAKRDLFLMVAYFSKKNKLML